jgi:hypothetical protein
MNAQPTTAPAKRHVAGRLNGTHAEAGTILGPRGLTGEWLVVLDNDDQGVTLGYATTQELEAAVTRPEPRSVAEVKLRSQIRGLVDELVTPAVSGRA